MAYWHSFEQEEKEKEAKVYESLLAKSKLYEKMLSNTSASQSPEDDDSILIDFGKKKENQSEDCIPQKNPTLPSHSKSIEIETTIRKKESQQWNWSRGDSSASSNENRSTAPSQQPHEAQPASARIKTQWEKVLGSSAKVHLAEVHNQVEELRERDVPAKRETERELRLQMLKAKQQQALDLLQS